MMHSKLSRLLGATALVAAGQMAAAQDGFSISINGAQVAGDARPVSQVRRTDLALQQADVQISFDGLGAEPRLDLEVVGTQNQFKAGDTVTLISALNYPAYVTRGELRFVSSDRGKTVLVTAIAPNGTATVQVPEGEDLVILHRVYDAQGRYDETSPIRLSGSGGTATVEEGDSLLARQRIPVYGGAITVTGQNVAPGATVVALGEEVATDSNGRFAVQRILPAGEYGVDVKVRGGGQNLMLERQLEVPGSQWFKVGTIDLTYGQRRVDSGAWESYDTGRLAFFAEGRTASGWQITASANSGEGPIADIFSRFEERDPRSLLGRVDPNDLYPTFGDDSSIEDRTPTSGNLFLRVERDGNYLQWGDFDANLNSYGYVNNGRKLYGASGYWGTASHTAAGEPRAQVYAYAAQPDQVAKRDVLLATGGSVYFLNAQDIGSATETITIQTRDSSTGRILSSQRLTAGADYAINYIQGIVALNAPLQSSAGDDGFGNSNTEVVLVAQYEYTPTLGDVSGLSYGGRAEGWVTDQIRVGVSGMIEETGGSDQQLVGADVTYQHSEQTFARLEYAQSEGPGFGSTFSADGGLIFDTTPIAAGTGTALKFDVQADLAELGVGVDGRVQLYFEDRKEGFSTLDTQVVTATGDETLWGFAAEYEATETISVKLSYDDYTNAAGNVDRRAFSSMEAALNDQLTLALGLEVQDLRDSTDDGTRTDLAARLDYQLSDTTTIYGFARGTVQVDGLDRNDRAGFGGRYDLGNGWTLAGEASGGTDGAGGEVFARYSDDSGNTRYVGYALDPSRTVTGVSLNGRDNGQFVLGGREKINETVAVFSENTYDMFGNYRSLTSAYGVTLTPTDVWSTTVALEFGRVEDDFDNDFERNALSIGQRYATDQIEASARLEYATENGLRSGADIDSDTLLIAADATYKLDNDQRLVFSADLARTETDDSVIVDGDYADITFGYAYRPAEASRLNMLARYRYLMDEYGQVLDGTDARGPQQRSHVASFDLSYNLNQNWTLGGKLGYRMSETAASEGDPYIANDAWLAVANARYHLVNEWDALLEVRSFNLVQSEISDIGVLAAAYRQVNENVSLGVGYNFGSFSDDLTDMVQDDEGFFVNFVTNF